MSGQRPFVHAFNFLFSPILCFVKVDAPEGAPATYTNYWGYEIELLKSISNKLNFKYNFSNVEDGKWGHIEAGPSGKEWSGMVGQVRLCW